MTQEQILTWAREAGISSVWAEASTRQLERFAALVSANLFTYDQVKAHIQAAVITEREACAKVCDEYAEKCVEAENWEAEDVSLHCAAAIRARGEK